MYGLTYQAIKSDGEWVLRQLFTDSVTLEIGICHRFFYRDIGKQPLTQNLGKLHALCI